MNKKARSKNPLNSKSPFKWVFIDLIPSTAPKLLTSGTTFSNYILIVHAYSKITKLYCIEKITTEEVMDNLDMFQSRSGIIDKYGWWYLEIISEDTGNQFTSTEFKEECQTCGVHLTLAAPEHRVINGKIEVTCRTLRTIAHSLMVHAIFLEAYIHFAFIYTTDPIFLVLPIKDMINGDGEPTTPFKLATGTKPSASHLRMLFFPCVVRKSTVYVLKKALNMRHQAQKSFCGFFVGILQHQKGYFVYLPSTRKIIS